MREFESLYIRKKEVWSMCVTGIPYFMGTKCPHKHNAVLILTLWGHFLVPMRKTAYKSYRMKSTFSVRGWLCVCVRVLFCEGRVIGSRSVVIS